VQAVATDLLTDDSVPPARGGMFPNNTLSFLTLVWPRTDFACLQCTLRVPTAGDLSQHCNTDHRAGLAFVCGLCRKAFGKLGVLGVHMRLAHNVLPPPGAVASAGTPSAPPTAMRPATISAAPAAIQPTAQPTAQPVVLPRQKPTSGQKEIPATPPTMLPSRQPAVPPTQPFPRPATQLAAQRVPQRAVQSVAPPESPPAAMQQQALPESLHTVQPAVRPAALREAQLAVQQAAQAEPLPAARPVAATPAIASPAPRASVQSPVASLPAAPAHTHCTHAASASRPPHALPEAPPPSQAGLDKPTNEHVASSDDAAPEAPSASSDDFPEPADPPARPNVLPTLVAEGPTIITTGPSKDETREIFVSNWLAAIELALEDDDEEGFYDLIPLITDDWLATARQTERDSYRGKRKLRQRPSAQIRKTPGDDCTSSSRVAPADLRRIYRVNRPRAMRLALQPPSTTFKGSHEACRTHWESEGKAREVDLAKLDDLLLCMPDAPPTPPNLAAPLTAEEVGKRLHRANNTAPGADRLEYRHLRALDPEATLITAILNGCLRFRRVPAAWRTGSTILLHKKGDPADPGNFRPITLLPTLYKLLAGCLAARLSSWAKASGVLSPQQKGFVPAVEGCLEQSFLVAAAFEESRDVGLHKRGLPIFSAFLDLQNAFGSVPHTSLLRVLTRVGVDDGFLELVKHLYDDSSVILRINDEDLAPFHVTAGVRQGDPLSPILFDLAMEPVVRRAAARPELGFPLGETRLTVCALADDLALFADSADNLQRRITATSEAASIVGLRFRPEKCAVVARCANDELPARIILQGARIPCVDRDHAVTYLGAPQGLSQPRAEFEQATLSLIRDINLLKACSLAPWQKLDALRTFLLPRLDYLCRARYAPGKKALEDVDSALIAFCREICSLTTCTSTTHYIFGHRANGGLGLVRLVRNAQILHVTQACRMLTAEDPTIVGVARHRLASAIDRAKGDATTDEGVTRFLGGDGLSDQERLRTITQRSRHTSFWSDVRRCLLDLGVRLNFVGGRLQSLTHSGKAEKPIGRRRPNATPIEKPAVEVDLLPRLCTQKLRQFARDAETAEWKARRVQGAVARCLELDPYATHSRFIWSGTGVSYRTWRFAFRARLQVLHTRVQLTRYANARGNQAQSSSHLCRVCRSSPETLEHVLDHCKPLFRMVTDRHNRIVKRLADALPRSTAKVLLDKQPVADIRRRPDLTVWTEKGEAVLVDVTCPFESGEGALEAAFQRKEDHYAGLARAMLTGDVRSAVVRPFVVGALGGWHPGNEQCLESLGIPRYRRKLLRELCVADAISGSEAIWSRVEAGLTDRREAGDTASSLPLPGADPQVGSPGRCGTARARAPSPQPSCAPPPV